MLLHPEQDQSNYANACFHWFESGDIARNASEALSIHHMIGAVVAAQGIDRNRPFVTGLFAGGATVSVMLATYPEPFAGLPAAARRGCSRRFPPRGRARRAGPRRACALIRRDSGPDGPWPTISVWLATADLTVNPDNAEAIVNQSAASRHRAGTSDLDLNGWHASGTAEAALNGELWVTAVVVVV